MITLIFVCLGVSEIYSLDNGLALTPPMGWMSWERFRCLINCTKYPYDCISENLFKSTADRLADDGYLEAGYKYLIIDDCWLATERNELGLLQADPERFPNGIKALADYVHGKGLKFGIYGDHGTYTCGGYPGSIDHLKIDAETFANWGVDYLKLDGCYCDVEGMEEGYAKMGHYLNQTGRPVVYSCSFPAYKGIEANYSAAVEICNLWRNYGDIQDSWLSVQQIVNWFVDNEKFLAQFAGPGHWNDPDMLIIGNYGLSYDQCISQMTIWSIMPSPLIMSVDLRTIRPEFKKILLNEDAIKINQDPLGSPGILITKQGLIYIWLKPILPKIEQENSYAIAFVSFRDDGYPYKYHFSLDKWGFKNKHGYVVKNVFQKVSKTINVSCADKIEITVNPSGAVLLMVTPNKGD